MPRILLALILLALRFAPAQAQAELAAHKAAAKAPDKTGRDCGCEIELPSDVLAVAGGVRIGVEDVDERIKAQLDGLREQVIAARGRELDLQINSRLLDAEAGRRGVSATKLIDEVILAKVRAPTEAELQAFYHQNRQRIQAEFKDVKSELAEYLLELRRREEAGRFAAELRAAAKVQVNVTEVDPPASEAGRARVLAAVNGQSITAGDVEDALRPFVLRVQEQLYQLRQGELNLRINDTLLQQEAQKRRVTPAALLSAEIKARGRQVTEDDARKFYEENRARVSGDFAQVKAQIVEYLQSLEDREVETAFAAELRRAASVQVFLAAPEPPVFTIAVDDQPVKGDASAPVTVVEFTDFQCSSCAATQPVVEQLLKEYAGRVRLVVRDFPLDKHADAFKAAEAAEAARAQGKYREFTALLFRHQAALSVERLKEYASQLGLDRKQFDAALDAGAFADKVQRDLQEGRRLGVSGTPALFVNGRRVAENSYESLKAAVEAALGAKKQRR
jgi:protein-disulfide isomerase